jgi:hypothetical protein
MDIYNNRPELFREIYEYDDEYEKYKLTVCFDEILEKKPKIEIKTLLDKEIKNYIIFYKKIHYIIYNQEPQQILINDLLCILNNEKNKKARVKKSLNFLNYNISLSLSYIYYKTKKYDSIFILFDILVRLKMNKQILSIYPLIIKIKKKISTGIDYTITTTEDIKKIHSISFNYDKIEKILLNISNISHKLIFAIYHLFPVRLSKEYRIMYVKKEENIIFGKNYYDYVNKTFIFNNINFSVNDKETKIKVPKKLSDIIDRYIYEKGIKHNIKLISFNIEKKFNKIMKEIYSYDFTTIEIGRAS